MSCLQSLTFLAVRAPPFGQPSSRHPVGYTARGHSKASLESQGSESRNGVEWLEKHNYADTLKVYRYKPGSDNWDRDDPIVVHRAP